jgi:hypothetical protein
MHPVDPVVGAILSDLICVKEQATQETAIVDFACAYTHGNGHGEYVQSWWIEVCFSHDPDVIFDGSGDVDVRCWLHRSYGWVPYRALQIDKVLQILETTSRSAESWSRFQRAGREIRSMIGALQFIHYVLDLLNPNNARFSLFFQFGLILSWVPFTNELRQAYTLNALITSCFSFFYGP